MPFKPKYNNLGATEKIRIPKSHLPHIEILLNHYNRILETRDNDYIIKLQQNIEKGLENIN